MQQTAMPPLSQDRDKSTWMTSDEVTNYRYKEWYSCCQHRRRRSCTRAAVRRGFHVHSHQKITLVNRSLSHARSRMWFPLYLNRRRRQRWEECSTAANIAEMPPCTVLRPSITEIVSVLGVPVRKSCLPSAHCPLPVIRTRGRLKRGWCRRL